MHRLVDCYASYFGALTCVAWSPDGRFILVSEKITAEKLDLKLFSLIQRLAVKMIC